LSSVPGGETRGWQDELGDVGTREGRPAVFRNDGLPSTWRRGGMGAPQWDPSTRGGVPGPGNIGYVLGPRVRAPFNSGKHGEITGLSKRGRRGPRHGSKGCLGGTGGNPRGRGFYPAQVFKRLGGPENTPMLWRETPP